MKTLFRLSYLLLMVILISSCGEEEKLTPDPLVITFRGELGGVKLEMIDGVHLFPDGNLVNEHILSFFGESSATTLDNLEIRIPNLRADKTTYTVANKEFSIYFIDSMTLSGASKGEWESTSGTLQITSYSERIIKGKIVNATLKNVNDSSRTIRFTSADFTAEDPLSM